MRIPLVVLVILAFAGGGWAQALSSESSLHLTLQEVMQRARQYSQQVYTADIAAKMAHEDTVQAKAGLLPTASGFSQYIYTQANGSLTGTFVSNDGVHVYNDQLLVHGEVWNPQRRADYRRTIAAEALARARADLALRGLNVTVVQYYYGLVVAERRITNSQQSLLEAQKLVEITQKQEAGGEAAHADVIKAQIQLEQRRRDLQDSTLGAEKARIELAVLIFPAFGESYSVVDDLASAPALPAYGQVQELAVKNNPDIRAAQAAVLQQTEGVASARAGYLPTVSFDYFFGLNSNYFAIHNPDGFNQLGSVAQAQLEVPLWTWGAQRSRVKQARLQLQQAQKDLSLVQRTLLSEEASYYLEAQSAGEQTASLKKSADLATDSLRLTLERYEAGEASILDVVDAQSTLAESRNAYDDGLSRYRLALANLQSLTGAF